MFNYKFVTDRGVMVIIRACTYWTAIDMYCRSEGCSFDYVKKHCVVKRVA